MRKLIVVIVVPWTCAFGGVMSVADVSVADFPRLAGETGDSVRIMRAVDAAGRGGEGDQGGGRRGRAVQAHCRPAREAQEGRPGARARGVKREGRAPSRP